MRNEVSYFKSAVVVDSSDTVTALDAGKMV